MKVKKIIRIIIVLVVLGFVAMALLENKGKHSDPMVKIRNAEIKVEVVTSAAAQARGLSGRPSLGANNGMLFAFSKPDKYRFWMPDMKFPLDIIWISRGRIVDINRNVSNKFDPNNPVYYSPIVPVQYVLEVNAGYARRHGIGIGDKVEMLDI